MRTTLLLGVLLAGCGVSDAQLNDVDDGDLAAAQGELGSSARSYVVLRRDMRRCVAPMCGGYWAHDVNRANLNEQYVSALDFSRSDLQMPEDQADVLSAGNFEVVLYGKLGPVEPRFHTRTFIVSSAFRGMPGVQFTEPADVFYRVESAQLQCFAAPCPTLRASKLHSTTKILHHDLDVARASLPLVDQNWLTGRVIENGALVAGRFVDNHHRVTEQYPLNPNGTPLGMTALTTTTGRVTIMMPHPERVFRSACMSWAPKAWSEDSPWMQLFYNAREWVG